MAMGACFRFCVCGGRWLFNWAVLCGLVAVAGCVSIEQLAPPVDEALLGVSAGYGADAGVLARGRAVYVNSCIKCHSLEPLTRYEPGEWDVIVEEMAVEAKLTGEQTADLRAYLAVSRRFVVWREGQGE